MNVAINRDIMTRQPAVIAHDVGKWFYILEAGDKWRLLLLREPQESFAALTNVSFEVPRGEFLGVLGRNGAGKSTLLQVVGGAYAPTSGQVRLTSHTSAIYELGVGGNDQLTGREFATRWFSIYGTGDAKLAHLLEEVKEFSELEEYFDRPIFSYSSGMGARLYFSVATALPGQIYLIDEVLSVGDEYFQNKSWRRIRSRLADGASGIVATHDFTAVLKLCEQALILDRGSITAIGAAPSVVQRYLELDPPVAEKARFVGLDPRETRVAARSDEDIVIEVAVKSDTDMQLLFGASVEVFQRALGWEHLLHLSPTPFACGRGRHTVKLVIPKLLNAGEYSLNLYLTGKSDPASSDYEVLDAHSWIHGNGLTLSVEGPHLDSIFTLLVEWTIESDA